MNVRTLVGAVISLKPRTHPDSGDHPHNDSGTQYRGSWEPIRVPMLFLSGLHGLCGTMNVCWVDHDVCGPVIERLHHLAFVKRDPPSAGTAISIATDGPCAFLCRKLI